MLHAERVEFVRNVLNECRGHSDDVDSDFYKAQINRIVDQWEDEVLDPDLEEYS